MAEHVMPWNEFYIATTDTNANELSDELSSLGAVAITFQDAGNQPIFEPAPETPRLWRETILIALFEQDAPIDPILDFLATKQSEQRLSHFHQQLLEDEDWERRCLEGFKAICCGQRLWICPSWQTPPDPNAVNVILDPGLAFGTGTHATTRLCLEWLDANFKKDETIIDYGCGSGILAIAALKLGAKKAYAIDNDPQALEATLDNSVRNNLDANTLIAELPNYSIPEKADVLIANILAGPLVELAKNLANLVKPNGKIILSGILDSQITEVEDAYKPWFLLEKPLKSAEWVRLTGTKKGLADGKNLNSTIDRTKNNDI
jgi:ribosomal protein L11 methyltransferase